MNDAPPNANHRRRRRWLRRLAVAVIATPVILAPAAWLTQGLWLPAVVRPVVERLTGLSPSSSSLRLTMSGALYASDVTLRDPATEGPPIVSAAGVDATLNWANLFTGGPILRDVVLRKPIIRVFADQRDQASAMAAPLARARRGVRGLLTLPEVEILGGAVVFMEPGRLEDGPILTMRGAGSLRRRAKGSSRYDMTIEQTGAGEPVHLSGWIDLATRSARLESHDVELTHWLDSCSIGRDAELWRSIVFGGRVAHAVVEYTPGDGLRSSMDVAGVRLDLPMPANAAGADRLTLDEVRGHVTVDGAGLRAQVAGLIGGLPTLATLRTEGLGLTTPFRLDLVGGPFMLDTGWAAIALVPPDVREVIDDFSGPRAQVTTRIRLARDGCAKAYDEGVSVSGEARIAHGSMSSIEFAYPIHDIAGAVRFDEHQITLDGLTGVGPTGAPIQADGVITPTRDGLAADLTIRAAEAPIDDALFAAVTKDEADIIRSLFDVEATRALAAAGVFVTGAQRRAAEDEAARRQAALSAAQDAGDEQRAAAIRAALVDTRTALARPVFEPGGRADVTVHLVRNPTQTPRRRVTVDVTFDRAGLVYKDFPYPVVAKGFRVRIDHAGVTVLSAPVRGLAGGGGEITGQIRWDGPHARPDLRIRFDDIPVDGTLRAAVSLIDGVNFDAAGMLARLGARGAVSGEARIGRDEPDATAWSVNIPLEGVVLDPARPDTAGARVERINGTLAINPAGWTLDKTTALVDGNDLSLSIAAPADPSAPIVVHAQAPEFSLETPIELIARAFDTDLADRVAQWRSRFHPTGAVDAALDAELGAGRTRRRLTLRPAGPITFMIDDAPTEIEPEQGRVVVSDRSVEATDLALRLRDAGGADQGRILLGGSAGGGAGTDSFRIKLENLAPESVLVRALVRSMDQEAARWLDSTDLTGRIDGWFSLSRGGRDAWRFDDGELEPHALALTAGGRRVDLGRVGGSITLGPDGGKVRALTAETLDWTVAADGSWFSGVTPGMDLRLVAHGARVNADLIAILPAEARTALEGMNAGVSGGFTLRNASLAINAPRAGVDVGDGFRDGARFSGSLEITGASLDAGVPLRAIDGVVDILVQRPPGVRDARIELRARAPSLTVAGVTVTDLIGSMVSAPDEPGRLDAHFVADSHGGKLVLDGAIDRPPVSSVSQDGSAGGAASYRFELALAGLDLTSVIDSFATPHADAGARPEADSAKALGRRGYVDASLVVGGSLAPGAEPRGEGEVRILGGELARLPLVMTVLELGKLVPPIGERLDYASARFTLRGDRARFDRLIAVSPSLALIGDGTVTFPDAALDLRFGVTSNRRLPVFSLLFDALRNELLTTRIRGTLADPSIRVEPLSGTRRFLSRLFGGPRRNAPVANVSDDESSH